MKPYRDDVTLDQIINDGWSRGFMPEQTLREASIMGFDLSREQLLSKWQALDDDMDRHFK